MGPRIVQTVGVGSLSWGMSVVIIVNRGIKEYMGPRIVQTVGVGSLSWGMSCDNCQ